MKNDNGIGCVNSLMLIVVICVVLFLLGEVFVALINCGDLWNCQLVMIKVTSIP